MICLKKYAKYLFLFFCVPMGTMAQGQGIGNEQVNIVQEYKPVITPAEKITSNPDYRDTIPPAPALKYGFVDRKPEYRFRPDTIKAARMKGEPLSKIFPGLLRIGGGNYNTFFADVKYLSQRSKTWQYGMEAKHLSSSYMAMDYGRAGFSDNRLQAHGKYISDKYSISSALSYAREANRFYSYTIPTLPIDFNPEKDRNEFHYNILEWKAALRGNVIDSSSLKHHEAFMYRRTWGSNGLHENQFDFSTRLEKSMGKDLYGATFSVSHFSTGGISVYRPNMPQLSSSSPKELIAQLNPSVQLRGKNLVAVLGLKAFLAFNEGRFRLAPDVSVRYKVFQDYLNAYLFLGGGLARNSLHSIITDNPFLGYTNNISNAYTPIDASLGLKGKFVHHFYWDLSVRYRMVQNMLLFTGYSQLVGTDPSLSAIYFYPVNRFTTVLDNVSRSSIQLMLHYKGFKGFDIGIRAAYHQFTTETQSRPWYQPDAEGNLWISYVHNEKADARFDLIYRGNTYGTTSNLSSFQGITLTQNTFFIKAYPDINFTFNYHHNKRLGFFARACNIIGARYQRWLEFPTQSFNIQAGLQFVY